MTLPEIYKTLKSVPELPPVSEDIALIFKKVIDLIKIGEGVKNRQILSFEDLGKINELLKTTNESSLNEILTILKNDIELRNEVYRINCIEELYSDYDLLPGSMHIPRSEPGDVKSLIYERMTAIALHECGRLQKLAGLEFIEGKISYDEYKKKIWEYALIGSKLCSR